MFGHHTKNYYKTEKSGGFMVKKAQKQFPLDGKENCRIYLLRIVTTAELCIIRLKEYNTQGKAILDKYADEKIIPYDIYIDFADKTENVTSYLLNILGDAQSSSISYFKYRKQAKKLMQKDAEGIKVLEWPNELEELLNDFNRLRNWSNHVPESLLISEIDLIEQGKAQDFPYNPIELNLYKSVTYEYFQDLYATNVCFYEMSRKLIQAAKRDYGTLIQDRVIMHRVYLDRPVGMEKLTAAEASAGVQGIRG